MNAPAQIKAEPKLLTFDEFFAKWEGVHENVDLIDGEEVHLPSDGPLHSLYTSGAFLAVADAIRSAGLWGKFRPFFNPTIKLSERTAVAPDVGVFHAGVIEQGVFGSWETVVLAIETSDTTLSYDQGRKSRTYARHGLQELWIKRVRTQDVRVRRRPEGERYVEDTIHSLGDTLHPLFAPELSISVSDLFDR